MTTGPGRSAAWVPASLHTREGNGTTSHSGVIVFADVSGFTALTEHLRRTAGRRGIEALTARINAVFEGMIAAVHSTGGEVLKFGGDAILVSFRQHDAMARSMQCAARLHAVVRRNGRIVRGRSLSLHVGVSKGRWTECVTGLPGLRREHFVFGPAVDHAFAQADLARNGETRLHLTGRSSAPAPGVKFKRVKDQPGLLIMGNPGRSPALGATIERPEIRASAGCEDFVPLPLRETLNAPTFDFVRSGEHRRVSTLFVFWRPRVAGGWSPDSHLWESVFTIAHETSTAHGGLWARSDPGSGYQKLLILFGTPTSHGDDVDRAVACAEELRGRFQELSAAGGRLSFGLGLTTQTVYCGYVGAAERMEFTAMGEGVNLAARLAAGAKRGRILVDEATCHDARRRRFTPGPRLKLKGVTHQVPTLIPNGTFSDDEQTPDDHVVEHPRALAEALRVWHESGSRSLVIHAAHDTDPRRFLAQLLKRIDHPAAGVIPITFSRQEAAYPLGGVARLLKSTANPPKAGESADQHTTSHAPEGCDPVVWQAVHGDERALRRTLERDGTGGLERETTTLLRTHLSARRTETHGLLIAMDHVEVLSEIDQNALFELCRVPMTGCRFIMVQRGATCPDGGQHVTIILRPAEKMEMREVLEQIIPPEAISSRLLEFLQERSKGIVRLARLYLDSLMREGYLTRPMKPGRAWRLADLSQAELPDSLRAHFLQRLDRLPRDSVAVARALAVLGDSAPASALEAVLRPEMGSRDITQAVAQLETAGLVVCDNTQVEPWIGFVEAEHRMAIYETMSFAQRESLHREAASFWSVRGRAGNEEAGRHQYLGGLHEHATPRLLKAARRAHRLAMLPVAQELYHLALLSSLRKTGGMCERTVPDLPSTLTTDQASLLRSYSDVLRERGLYPDASAIHARLALYHKWAGRRADALRERLAAARVDWLAGRYGPAERQATGVLRAARVISASDIVAQAQFVLGEVMRRTGRLERANRQLADAADTLERSRNWSALADVLNTRGIVAWNLGKLDEAGAFFRSALGRLRTRKDAPRRGQIANNLGILFEEAGRLPIAARHYQRAFEIFDAAGHRRNRAYCLGNLANLHRHAARFEAARAAYEEAEFELSSIGERHAAAYTWGNLGDLHRDFGQWDKAVALYERTLDFARRVEDAELESECLSRLAEIHINSGQGTRVDSFLDAARKAARKARSKEFRLRAEILNAIWIWRTGNGAKAARMLDDIAARTRDSGLLYYRLWVDAVRAEVMLTLGYHRDAARLSAAGLTHARRAGYRWWELHFAISTARAALKTSHTRPPRKSALQATRRAEGICTGIEQTVGDSEVRSSLRQTPIFRSFLACLDEHRHARPGQAMAV